MRGGEKTIKNLFLILAALVFAGGVLGTSVVRTTAKTMPQEKVTSSTGKITPSPQATAPSADGATKVDYYLPYPGILPDHSLYSLKMLRDRVWLFLTMDPVKKGELLLLFADKRLGAGKALIEGGKTELGISTLTKGEKYLEQSVSQAEKARQSGKNAEALIEKLSVAALKHEEFLKELLIRVPDQSKPALQEALRYSQEGYQKVTGMK